MKALDKHRNLKTGLISQTLTKISKKWKKTKTKGTWAIFLGKSLSNWKNVDQLNNYEDEESHKTYTNIATFFFFLYGRYLMFH